MKLVIVFTAIFAIGMGVLSKDLEVQAGDALLIGCTLMEPVSGARELKGFAAVGIACNGPDGRKARVVYIRSSQLPEWLKAIDSNRQEAATVSLRGDFLKRPDLVVPKEIKVHVSVDGQDLMWVFSAEEVPGRKDCQEGGAR